jgi:hypothetical protein
MGFAFGTTFRHTQTISPTCWQVQNIEKVTKRLQHTIRICTGIVVMCINVYLKETKERKFIL